MVPMTFDHIWTNNLSGSWKGEYTQSRLSKQEPKLLYLINLRVDISVWKLIYYPSNRLSMFSTKKNLNLIKHTEKSYLITPVFPLPTR